MPYNFITNIHHTYPQPNRMISPGSRSLWGRVQGTGPCIDRGAPWGAPTIFDMELDLLTMGGGTPQHESDKQDRVLFDKQWIASLSLIIISVALVIVVLSILPFLLIDSPFSLFVPVWSVSVSPWESQPGSKKTLQKLHCSIWLFLKS